MLKSIKKSFKYLTIFIGIILLVPTSLYLLIQIPDIQTFIVKRITAHYSDQIKSTITVGRFEYAFFNKLILENVLIKDQNNDTLIYSEKITAGIRRLDFRNTNIRFGRIEVIRPHVALITDTTGLMNLNWYLDMLVSPDTTSSDKQSNVSIEQAELRGAQFSLVDRRSVAGKGMIDFSNLHIDSIDAEIRNFLVKGDSTSFNINRLCFTEKNGFIVKDLVSSVTLADHDIFFSDIKIKTGKTDLNVGHVSLIADSSASFGRFKEEVRVDILLEKSVVSTADLQYFLPFLEGSVETAEVSGRVAGTVGELKGRNINLRYGSGTHLECDFDFSGLSSIEDAFIHVGVNTLVTSAPDIERVYLPGKGRIRMPEIVHKLGEITFDGSFTGFVSDFVTYGKLGTEKGQLRTDLSVRPHQNNRFKIRGLIAGSGIDIGELTGRPELLGRMSMETTIDGFASSLEKIEGNLTGIIDSIQINNYIYRNVSVNGLFTEKTWDGSIGISDRNIRMDLLGMFDFRKDLPEFDFTLNLAESNLHELNLDKSDSTSALSMLVTANFRGNNIDNLFGEIKLLNSNLRKYGNSLDLYNFSLKAFTDNNRPAISLRTDYVDADLRGYYNFGDINNVLKSALASLMPARFRVPAERKSQIRNDFNLTVNFKNTDKINNFFRTGIFIADKSTIIAGVHPGNIIRIGVKSKALTVRKNTFRDLAIDAGCYDGKLNAELRSSGLSILGESELKGFTSTISTVPDNFVFNLFWDNREKIKNNGNLRAIGYFSMTENQRPVLHINIDSSEVYTRNNLWKIRRSDISVDSTSVDFNKIMIVNKRNFYLVDGKVSENPRDTLRLEFRGIELDPLNQIFTDSNEGEDRFQYDFRGTLNGNIFLTNILKSPLLESDLTVSDFSLLGSEYGDLTLITSWNSSRKVADIFGSNNLRGEKNLEVKGIYDPRDKLFNINAKATKLPVDALNPLLDFFASEISGTATGQVNLRGERGNLSLTGALMAENTSLKIDYLGTRYTINDTIRFDRKGIKFRNIRVTDQRGNFATLSGSVNHQSFKNFTADLIINLNDCQVLNTQSKDNELFYGTAFARGVTTIKSEPNLLSFDISARTGKNTRFFIPLNSGMSVSESSFISFVTTDTLKTKDNLRSEKAPVASSAGSVLELNIDLDVTPEAELQMLIDPKAGDVIRGRGTGQLNISLNRKGEFKISGDYIIDEGEYLFTLGNVLNKRFDVENGGKITFNGDVENAEIDLKAIYRNLKTSLYPILGEERYNERIPVEPQLNLSGRLFNPVVGLNIYLPNADEETRSLLRNSITTEEELSRQFLYLLVMNSFYQDPSMGASSGSTASTGTSAMAVTTTEMLSNQLSNWLSQIYNDFDIGFVYRPGNKEINSQELQVALSTQLLNDRVVVNGNFDFRGANNSYGNPITGDFDVEYKITEKIRFKVFNRFNNPYTGRGAPYTQGLGLFYKHDFNKLFNFNPKIEQSDMKKEDEVVVK
ncbi:MAG: hypothetical protein GYA41_13570 [Bacteroidales bacterium]|nr:hypothetical protein [Bacteroidales bacterium]